LTDRPIPSSHVPTTTEGRLTSALTDMARERAASLWLRLVFGAFVGLGCFSLTELPGPVIIWAMAVCITQAISHTVSLRFLRSADPEKDTAKTHKRFVITTFVAALAYSGISLPLAGSGIVFGEMFAVLSVCGGMLHVALSCYQARWVYIAGLLGHGLNVIGVITISAMSADGAPYIGPTVLVLGFFIYLAHLMVVFRQNATSSQALREARDEAIAQSFIVQSTARAKSRFLAAVSHELRTPLNGILGSAALMRRHPQGQDMAALSETLTTSCDALRRILDDLLDLAKVEAGQIALQVEPFSANELLREIETVWGPTAAERGLGFSVTREPQLDGVWLAGDKGRIRQTLVNLVSNAVKYTRTGTIRLTLSADQVDSDWNLRFDVSDTGPGIPDDLLDRLFTPFSQGSDANAFEKGTGLGLSIAREVARLMHGDVYLQATSATGTTFRAAFHMPQTEEKPTAALDEDSDGLIALPSMRVLVVEDHAVNRTVIGRFLTLFGQQAFFAVDGREGVELAEQESFDLILMDLRMPRLSGLDAISEIRTSNGPNRDTPIAILSAEAMAEDKALGLGTGAQFYLTKPIDPTGLLDVLNSVASGAGAQADAQEPHLTPQRLGYL